MTYQERRGNPTGYPEHNPLITDDYKNIGRKLEQFVHAQRRRNQTVTRTDLYDTAVTITQHEHPEKNFTAYNTQRLLGKPVNTAVTITEPTGNISTDLLAQCDQIKYKELNNTSELDYFTDAHRSTLGERITAEVNEHIGTTLDDLTNTNQ